MASLIHIALSAIDEDAAEALVGLVIPAVQFGYKQFGARKSAVVSSSHRPAYQRWLLLYPARTIIGWILHALFFVAVACAVISLVDISRHSSGSDVGDSLVASGMFAAIALFIRWWALVVDDDPQNRTQFSVRPVVVMALLLESAILLAGFTDDNDNFTFSAIGENLLGVLTGTAIIGVLLFAAWRWTRGTGAPVPPQLT